MTKPENIRTVSSTRNKVGKRLSLFTRLLPLFFGVIIAPQSAQAQIWDCSFLFCNSFHEQTIDGYRMFDEKNFDPVVDRFGKERRFWVHLPARYDNLVINEEKMPVIFVFHGGSDEVEPRNMMLGGKWADYFYQDIAFVIPLAEPGPCDTTPQPQHRRWMGVTFGPGVPSGTPLPPDCDPATQHVDSQGDPITYNDASMANSFKDVVFIENLRAMILRRFPKLNENKVYATGFSSGGGMTNSLLCYRSNLFRGFSVVSKTLFGAPERGDYDDDGIEETDPNSLVATCGKSQWDPGRATGISTPRLWGYGITKPGGLPPGPPPIYGRVTRPVALFVGDQDPGQTLQELNETGAEIRARNNLNNVFVVANPFMNVEADDAETQYRRFEFASDASKPFSVFERYLVQRIAVNPLNPVYKSAIHGMPDAQQWPPLLTSSVTAASPTKDFSYTERTINFFRNYVGLNLNP